jgi:hypothetical protein
MTHAHLPNAPHIDRVCAHPAKWDAAWDAARDAAQIDVRAAVRAVAWDATLDATRAVAKIPLLELIRDARLALHCVPLASPAQRAAYAHLPNAPFMDFVQFLQAMNPQAFDVTTREGRSMLDNAWYGIRDCARDVAYDAASDNGRLGILRHVRRISYSVAQDALTALAVWDEARELLFMSALDVYRLAKAGHPDAVLLYPVVSYIESGAWQRGGHTYPEPAEVWAYIKTLSNR